MDATLRAPAPARTTALFVATNLDHFESDSPEVFASDVAIDRRAYRRLDPAYYAWLRGRVALAKQAHDSGRLATASFEGLLGRFTAVHAWAVARFGTDALLAAAKGLDARRYEPPQIDPDLTGHQPAPSVSTLVGFRFPPDGRWPFTHMVAPDAVARVDAIREQAIGLGWTERGLYQNRGRYAFPYGRDWGLVCFLDDGNTIGAIAREAITIRNSRGNALRLSNPDVEQPWERSTGERRSAEPLAVGRDV